MEAVAQTVGIPIEQQVNGVDGMLYMSSNSSSSGAYSLTITFAVGTDIDMATVQVQNRVSIAQSSLPEPVVVQGVTVQKQSSNIVMFLTMASQDSVYNSLYLTNYAKLNLVDQLTRVPGVGAVNVMGAGDYSMRGTPQTMQRHTDYPDMMEEIMLYFSRKVRQLRLLGVNDIILDPGFGFSKTLEQNYQLMSHLKEFSIFELPLLVGVSRKSMIYKLLGGTPADSLNGTTVLNTYALLNGANILRVHDVREAVEAIRVIGQMTNK